MQALAGLGNPGDEYAATRHNAGWMLLDRLAERGRIVDRREKEFVHLSRLQLGPDAIWLLRSKTYMNDSGRAVAQACQSLQMKPADVLVAFDEVDLPLGTLRIRRNGGAGGHRGMESLLRELGTRNFPRMRLGVAGQEPWLDTADYVLSDFEKEELPILEEMIDRGTDAVRMIMRRGIGAAMNAYNQKPEPAKPGADGAETPDKEPHP
jgi:PTH1 family peptidyl-tRNA hydrolase